MIENLSKKADEAIELELSLRTGELSLRDCELTEIPESVFSLRHLHALDIGTNKIESLPPAIANLKRLKSLRASINRLTSLPEQIGELLALENLELQANCLESLPHAIGHLHNLTQLSIGNNPIKELPTDLTQLTRLQYLIANNLELATFPEVITSLSSLRVLNLSHNSFVSIPREFVNLTNLGLLYLKNCPIERPPIEIISRGPQSIINYLHAFDEHEQTFEIREAKLIIVGQGAVGKTCLVKRVVEDSFDPSSHTTEGIEIDNWEISATDGNPFQVNIWDFGGQEIYHATHQFFLTKRSLYLFVWDARREDNILTFDYWFNVITLLSDASPVIVVMNKSDERTKSIDEESLVSKFQNIQGFFKVSAKTGSGVNELKAGIASAVVQLPHVGDVLPQSWLDIRNRLQDLQSNCIPYVDYLGICSEYGLPDTKAGFLAQYYHDLGVFLHFGDNVILRKTVFLRPEWATNAVYRLVDTKEVVEKNGRFHFRQLDNIWQDYPVENHIALLELMKKFELCFPLPDGRSFIVPELLSNTRPDFDWIEQENLHFTYQYDFMPAGIMTRFTVRIHDLIEGGIYWKNGVQIARDGTRALVVAEPLNRRIGVSINGQESQQLLAVVRREIDYIHNTLNNPSVQQLVPCVCKTCRSKGNPYMHDFDYLRRAKGTGKWTVECKTGLSDVPIVDILLANVGRKAAAESLSTEKPNITVYGDYYESAQNIGSVINVGGVNIRKEWSVDFGSRLGITPHNYRALVEALTRVPDNDIQTLHTIAISPIDNASSSGAVVKVKSLAAKHGIPILQNLGASAIFELLRYLFVG